MPNPFLVSKTFLDIAKKSFHDSRYNSYYPKDGGQHDTLVSIVFSALSVEAFLNELPKIADGRSEIDAVNLMNALQPMITGKKEIECKLFEASRVTSDIPFNRGQQPFQDFNLLIRLRNRIVHLLAGDNLSGNIIEHQKIISDLKSRQIHVANELIEGQSNPEQSLYPPFVYAISTQDVGKWSCNIAAKIVTSFVEGMRESNFKNLLNQYIEGGFQPIQNINHDDLRKWFRLLIDVGCNSPEEFRSKIIKGELIVTSREI